MPFKRRKTDSAKYVLNIKISKQATWGCLVLALGTTLMSPAMLNILPDTITHYIPVITTFIAALGNSIRE